jgi:hypothetical protein
VLNRRSCQLQKKKAVISNTGSFFCLAQKKQKTKQNKNKEKIRQKDKQ